MCGSALAQDVASSWYPLQPGDTWVYAKESLTGRMDRPGIERWTTEETVVSVVPVAGFDATLVTKRTRVLDHTATQSEPPATHLLIHRACVYVVDGPDAQGSFCHANPNGACLPPFDAQGRLRAEYRKDLAARTIPPDFCFPMAAGKAWGQVPNTSPAQEYVWRVDRLNGDPFGPPGAQTFHLWTHLGSGTNMDRWFTEGVGVVQEIMLHHGTYDESRRQLLRATLGGKTRTFQLTPARTAPLFEPDCEGPGWRHYVRADGTPFASEADCVRYTAHRK